MSKNPQRVSQRKTAGARQAEYVEATTLPDGQRDQHRPKFIKWLRGKFSLKARFGYEPAEAKIGQPYQRSQPRPQARSHRG